LIVPAGAAASDHPQKLVVAEVVCSSPSALFVAVTNAVGHMAHNPETQAYLSVVMAAVDIGRVGGAVPVVQKISLGTADLGAIKVHPLLEARDAPAWVRNQPTPLPNLAVATSQLIDLTRFSGATRRWPGHQSVTSRQVLVL
jgi:hypothetical protein